MPSAGNIDESVTEVTFDPARDEFRTTDVGEDEDEGLDDKYRQLALDVFGETDEKRNKLVEELREEVKRRGFEVPDKRAFYIKMLRAGR